MLLLHRVLDLLLYRLLLLLHRLLDRLLLVLLLLRLLVLVLLTRLCLLLLRLLRLLLLRLLLVVRLWMDQHLLMLCCRGWHHTPWVPVCRWHDDIGFRYQRKIPSACG